jgi:hypothetical protein
MLLKAARGVNATVKRSFYFFFQKEALAFLLLRAAAHQPRRLFFFEKKNQKTSIHLRPAAKLRSLGAFAVVTEEAHVPSHSRR